MDRQKALEVIGQGTADQMRTVEQEFDILYGTPGFDADGLTDFYAHDILTLGYEKADKRRRQWVDLLVALKDKPPYVVFPRLQLRQLPQDFPHIPGVEGDFTVMNAWIRVCEDLTPDKFVFTERPFPINEPPHVIESLDDMKGSVGHQSLKVIELHHPSYLFTHRSHPLAGMPLEDGPQSLFATNPAIPSFHQPGIWEIHQGEINETDLDFTFFTARSIEEIQTRLDVLDSQYRTVNHSISAVMTEHPGFMDWMIAEAERK